MNTAKLIFIYTAIAVFVATTITGILGAIGYIQFPPNSSAVTLVASCVGLVVTVLKAKHLFEDSEAVSELKQEQLDVVLRLKEQHHEAMLQQKAVEMELKTTVRSLSEQIQKQKEADRNQHGKGHSAFS